jgi:hypothetical protein
VVLATPTTTLVATAAATTPRRSWLVRLMMMLFLEGANAVASCCDQRDDQRSGRHEYGLLNVSHPPGE